MRSGPFFSIVIPTLNEEVFFPKLLDDLKNQKYKNFELVIVDGQSKDNTVREINKYKKNIDINLIITSVRNSRYQRNLGVSKVKGKYVILLEADVRVTDDYLQTLFEKIQKQKNAILTTFIAPDIAGFWTNIFTFIFNYLLYLALFINKPFAWGCNTIVRKDIYIKVKGYRQDLASCDDHDFTLRVCALGYKLAILRNPKIVFSYRRFRTNGYFKTLYMYLVFLVIFFRKGKILAKDVNYPMGGHLYKKHT